MRIAVIGIGYVGLVVAAGFAENGNDVFCMDVDEKKINDLMQGVVPIFEPGLEDLFAFNYKEGRLRFGTDISEAARFGEVIFLALPTPPNEDGSADVSAVLSVAEELGRYIKEYKIIVTKSTVPVGTADLVRARVAQHTASPFDVVSNPEFLKEGAAVKDFMQPDRVVVGSRSKHAIEVMQELYAPFLHSGKPFLAMDERSAEMTKYAANSFLAMKISYINEIREPMRRLRRGRGQRAHRNGHGRTHRHGISVSRSRIWRQLFPEGYSRAHQNRRPVQV